MKNRVYLFLDDKLFKLKELYFCVICSKIKSDFNLKQEIEYYYCNGCTQIYTKNETTIYSYECLRCFKCPFCFSCLLIAHKYLDSSDPNFTHLELGRRTINDNCIERINKQYKTDFLGSETYKNSQEEIKELHKDDSSNSDCINNGEDLKNEYASNEECNLKKKFTLNKEKELIEKDKKIFYFKCQYCLWSSIYSIYNTKLDELIGDMIIFENNCVFRCYYRNILNEVKKNNDLIKKRKILKKIDFYASKLKMENLNSTINWSYIKTNDSIENKDNEEPLEEEDFSLISKSNINIQKVSLKDILNAEHIKNDNKFNDIFELDNENIKYLDPVIFHNQTNLEENWENEKMDNTENDFLDKGGITCKEEKNINDIKAKDAQNTIEESCKGDYTEKNENNNSNKKSKKEIISLKKKQFSNVILHSKNYLSSEHICNYPYSFYKGVNELKPLRKQLLSKKSKRCSRCKQYLLKFHNSNLYSALRLNNNAMKYIPRISINDFRIIKKTSGILTFVLINPLDLEINIKIVPQIERSFLKNLSINKIPINCESKAGSFEFLLDTYDDIIDDLSKDENNIKTVITSENIIIKKQNNMALIIISFIYNEENMNEFSEKKKLTKFHEQEKDTVIDQLRNFNFPLILECSFSDKSQKVHKIKLNLIFTNNITTKRFYTYMLNL